MSDAERRRMLNTISLWRNAHKKRGEIIKRLETYIKDLETDLKYERARQNILEEKGFNVYFDPNNKHHVRLLQSVAAKKRNFGQQDDNTPDVDSDGDA